MEDPRIQELLELIIPPRNGYRPHITGQFGSTNRPKKATKPHLGLDGNYELGPKVDPQSGINLEHPPLQSPVHGVIEKIDPKLGSIVIMEMDSAGRPTGYRVEILHTQTRFVEKDDPVHPGKPIGTMGGVGVNGKGQPDGAQHMHVQVRDRDGNIVNPARHLYEYHHPGEPIPPLERFEPQLLPPRARQKPASQPENQGQPEPQGVPSSGSPPASAPALQLSPGMPIPGAEGQTSIGGPNGPTPLVPPLRSRSQAAPTRPAPETAPPLRFAPDVLPDHGPFGVPGPLRSDARDGIYVAPPVNGEASTNLPTLLAPAVGAPTESARPATSAVPGSSGWSGDGEGIDEGWIGSAPAAPSSTERFLVRRPGSPIRDVAPVDPIQPAEASPQPDIFASAPSLPPVRFPLEALFAPDHLPALNAWASSPPYRPAAPEMQGAPVGIPGLLAQVGAFNPSDPDQPPTGGLLELLQEYMRNNVGGHN